MPLIRSESCAFIWQPKVVTKYLRTGPAYPVASPLPTAETVGVSSSSYVLGHSDHELARLARQAALIGPVTRALLVEAGVGPGMRVLDIGTGRGDVALIAAELVGEDGSVVGVDLAPSAVAAARERVAGLPLRNVSFRAGDPAALDYEQPFDAVVGRYVLQFIPDPPATLRRARCERGARRRRRVPRDRLDRASLIPRRGALGSLLPPRNRGARRRRRRYADRSEAPGGLHGCRARLADAAHVDRRRRRRAQRRRRRAARRPFHDAPAGAGGARARGARRARPGVRRAAAAHRDHQRARASCAPRPT